MIKIKFLYKGYRGCSIDSINVFLFYHSICVLKDTKVESALLLLAEFPEFCQALFVGFFPSIGSICLLFIYIFGTVAN